MAIVAPSTAQWPQARSAAVAPVTMRLELDVTEADETYVLSDDPNAPGSFLAIDTDLLVIDA